MLHHIDVLVAILGLGSLYWLDIVAIVSEHQAAQKALSRATPWLLAGTMLLLYVPGFIQYGFSVLAVVTFCLFFGMFVGVAWMKAFVLPPSLSRLRWGGLLLGVGATVTTSWEIQQLYASEILHTHITAPITGISAFIWLGLFLRLRFEPPRRWSSRRS